VTRCGPLAAAAVIVLALVACSQLAVPGFNTPTPFEPAGGTEEPIDTAPPSTPEPTDTVSPTPISSEGSAIQALLDTERQTFDTPGAIALLRRGDSEWAASSGAADESGSQITADTRFRIASNTKPITAALILDAVHGGSFSLDDSVNDLVPGVLQQPTVTVRQLLSHTSGIFDEINQPDIFADIPQLQDSALQSEARDIEASYQVDERTIMPDRLIVALSETHDRYFAPGTDYHYSNTNYQLAGMILEKLTGMSLSDLLQAKMLLPLRLTHSTLLPPDTGSPEFRGYVRSTTDGSLIDVTDDLLIFGNGGPGGIITTADELLTMLQAIVSGQLLAQPLIAEMERPLFAGYGLGLGTYNLSCGEFFGHEGLTNGTQSIVVVSASGDTGAVIALNLRSQSDTHLADVADKMLCSTP
jgi:D-alanyl-D-alanine carboxypeptidase